MDKRDRSSIFAQRLLEALSLQDISRSELARRTGTDRSTIGQLLKQDEPRLPNGQLVASIATVLSVSTDWLLGLSNRPERPGEIISTAMALTPAERSSADTQILEWHKETAGSKIRHVPATLPDILKSEKTLEWEYATFGEEHSKRAIEAMNAQLDWLKSGISDYEIALPLHELEAIAQGGSYYEGLSQIDRHEQLRLIADIHQALYPRLRIFLFDAHQVFSSPVTIFGSNLAVVYIGQFYLAFRENQRVKTLIDHFDWLVRNASIDATNVSAHIKSLIRS